MAGADPPFPRQVAARLARVPDPQLEDECIWEGVELTGTVVGSSAIGVEIIESRLVNARFAGIELEKLRVVDSVADSCDFSGAILYGAVFERVEFVDCRMSGVVLAGARLRNTRFVRGKLDDANFRMVSGRDVRFEDTVLQRADFYEAKLPDVRFFDCDLRGAEFSKAEVPGARLHGSQLDGIKGAGYLKGIMIDPTQIMALALPVYAALGIAVDDEREPD